MSRKVKEIIRAAGLRDELTFTSFRHGGFTEAADAELTDAEIRAQGRHKSAKVLPTLRQAHHEAGRGRGEEAARDANESGQFVRMSSSTACQNGPTTMTQVIENIGAGEGNRTLVISLEGCCSTIELHPRRRHSHRTSAICSFAARMTDLCFSAMVGEVGLEPTKA